MAIFSPNIIITKNYSFMNNFMQGSYFSDLKTSDADDAIVFTGKQNRYVHSLEHSFNYGSADFHLTLKIVDVDGSFENDFFNETFYQRIMNNSLKRYVDDIKSKEYKTKFSNFEAYVSDVLDSQIKVYIAYGIGDDLDTWTDPIVCTLVAANIDASPNGVRNYTYKFIPEVNNFFRPEVKKNDNNPNEDVYFDFASVASETSYTIRPESIRKVRDNITHLLKGFVAKPTNVPIGNVIVLIPDLDDSIRHSASSIEVSTVDRGVFDSIIKTPTPISNIDFNDENQVKTFYAKVFKCISTEYRSAGIYNQTNGNFVNTINKQDVISQLQSDLRKAQDERLVSKSTLDDYEKENVYIDDPERVNAQMISIAEENSKLNADEFKLQTEYDRLIRERILAGDSEAEIIKKLSPYKTRISQIQTRRKKIKEILDKRKSEINELLSKQEEKEKKISSELSILQDNDPINDHPLLAQKFPGYESENYYHLTMRAEGDITNIATNQLITPNWRKAINDVFMGISMIYNYGENYVTPVVSFETNLRWLKLFKEVNLISDPTKPCIIIGDRQMVLDYIYCNQVPSNKIIDIRSNIKIAKNDPVLIAHENLNYKSKVVDLVTRKRNSSSFSEKLYLDELTINKDNPTLKNINLTIDELTKQYDIPVFVNNFRNSNIISYSLKNSENYISSLRLAVRNNRLKYLYSQLINDKEKLLIMLNAAGIKGDPSNLNPFKLAQELFAESVALLPAKLREIKLSKIDKDVADATADILKSDPKVGARIPEKYKLIRYKKSDIFTYVEETLGMEVTMPPTSFGAFDTRYKFNYPLIITQNSENVSYLNLALQNILYTKSIKNNNSSQIKYDIKKEELAAVAEFLILLNLSNEINGNNSVTLIPGTNLPNQNYILAKIHEYNSRFSIEMTLKTLPFFNLTDARTMNKPAIVYSKRVSLVGADAPESMDFFSGEYRIIGFRHVINTSECYSEFLLSKYLTSDEGIG